MKKRILVTFLFILLLNVITVYAGTAIYGYFQGFEKVKVIVDGNEVDSEVPGFIIDNTTVIPLRVVAQSLDAIIQWDNENKIANITKPNVNMQFTANPLYDKEKNTYVVYSPFGKIPKTRRYQFTFYVYSEVDNLPHEKVEFKLVLRDPDGIEVMESEEVHSFDASIENSLQYIDSFKDITFTKEGNYYVEFLLKSEATNNEFVKIGEKNLLVK